MAKKSVFNYKVKRGATGGWLVFINQNTYRLARGISSGTWYVSLNGAQTLFNCGTMRDCIIWICNKEQVL